MSAFVGVPAEVSLNSVSDDWCSIDVEGPEHYVTEIDDYPDKPFASGSFQVAFKARVISVGGKLLIKDMPYVFKQHNLQEYGFSEYSDSTLTELSEEFLQQLRTANEKKTAKVTLIARYMYICLMHGGHVGVQKEWKILLF